MLAVTPPRRSDPSSECRCGVTLGGNEMKFAQLQYTWVLAINASLDSEFEPDDAAASIMETRANRYFEEYNDAYDALSGPQLEWLEDYFDQNVESFHMGPLPVWY
jgi:hypothetical protein